MLHDLPGSFYNVDRRSILFSHVSVSKTSRTRDAPAVHGLTAALAGRAAGFEFEELGPEHVQRARHSLLDWLGVTLAGAQETTGRMVRAAVLAEGGDGPCTLVGTPYRLGPQSAALANGTAGHALDYDDSNFWMVGHPSVPVVSAALAVGEARGASGEDVAAAIVAGHEVAARVGLAVGNAHYLAGWHSTGTVGMFAAAAAAGSVLALDPESMEIALGLAATQAAGLKVSFGTMAKPLHGGRAAAGGVLAALLAEQGFTGPLSAIEGHQGFASTQTPDFDPERADLELGDRLGIEGVLYKKHACCGGTHGAINALQGLAVRADDVAGVHVTVSGQMFDICCIEDPRTGIEGKFSVRHAASLVLAGRSTGPSGFTDAAVVDPELLALRALVRVAESGQDTGHETTVTIQLRDGSELRAESDARVPATDDQLSHEWRVLCAKFAELAEPVLGADRTAEIVARVEELEHERDIGDLLVLTRSDDGR
jgi:2-methylcitrate dehydratase PrpD